MDSFMDGFVEAKEAAGAAQTHVNLGKTCTCMHILRATSDPQGHRGRAQRPGEQGFSNVFTKTKFTRVFFEFNLIYPPLVVRVFAMLSWLSLDFIDMGSPECSTGNLGYSGRWFISAGLPVIFLLPFFLIFKISERKDAKNRDARNKLENLADREIEEQARADAEVTRIKGKGSEEKKQANVNCDAAKARAAKELKVQQST